MADRPGAGGEVRNAPMPPPGAMGMPGGGGPGRGPVRIVRANNTKQTLLRLWGYLSQQKLRLQAVLLLTIANAIVGIIGPYLIGYAIDHYVLKQDYGGLLRLCLWLVGVYLIGTAASWLQAKIMVQLSQKMVWEMRGSLFSKLQQLPLAFFDSRPKGDIMSRATNDLDNVSNTLSQTVVQLISGIVTVAGALAIMLYMNIGLTLLTVVTIPLVMMLVKKIASFSRNSFAAQQKSLGELNGYIEENVSGHQVVIAFNRQGAAVQQFGEINAKLAAASIKAQIYSGTMGPLMNMLNNLNFMIVALGGGWMAIANLVSVGVVVSFLNYSRQLGRPINELANQYNMIQAAIAGAERVFAVMDEASEYESEPTKSLPQPLRGEVEFEHVDFEYKPGEPVLRDVSLYAKPGEMIALVGPTGAGKTTIINLLTRFYDIQRGTIRIDGIDIAQVDKDGLRRQLGIVLQDSYLFADTVRENIRYGRPEATDAEVEAAARLANADGFIRLLADGYDTPLTAGGDTLSHGQRQLMTIARAILADPAILILDEATSGIDTRTEMHIQEAMRTLMQGRTSFVIAHRLSTIRDADQILVIKQGEVVESGTHRSLLGQRGEYYTLVAGQQLAGAGGLA